MNDATIIDVKGLCKQFADTVVVNHINIEVSKGEIFGFLGPNGSGKTTTMRMLCGLLTPDAGKGSCLGFDILTESNKIKQHVGYMTQKFSFYTDLSIEENLRFIAQVYGMPKRRRCVEEALQTLGLYERRKQLTGSLSGGWKQRLALSACLLHKPLLLLLDEPTAGVDPISRRAFWDQIHYLSEQGITTFISTHYMDEAERCTRLAYLASGHLLITGTVNDVIEATGLKTWTIKGRATPALLQAAKSLKGVTQAALFGNEIHVSGFDETLIASELKQLSAGNALSYQATPTSLEDAFISLVKKNEEEKK